MRTSACGHVELIKLNEKSLYYILQSTVVFDILEMSHTLLTPDIQAHEKNSAISMISLSDIMFLLFFFINIFGDNRLFVFSLESGLISLVPPD